MSATGSNGGTLKASFSCLGQPTCTGVYSASVQDPGCSNSFSFGDTFIASGVDLSQPGTFQGTLNFGSDFDSVWPGVNGARDHPLVCTYTRNSNIFTVPYTGTWNGSSGTISATVADVSGSAVFKGTFTANVSKPPVFPMEVSGSITPTVSNISAQIQYRPQDVNTTGSVYVFALAPATQVVTSASAKDGEIGLLAKGSPKDAPVQCVLAQLTASGQLQGVSASNMQAFVSGVLSSQGQAVTVLNNVSTPQVAGATFFVGYGANATAMINNGVNRSAVTVPGAVTCAPHEPQAGWWWNPAEGGRGYSLEVQGNNIFFASYLYDASGRATWYVAAGPTSLEGSLFNGRLLSVAHGQTLTGTYHAPDPAADNGAITLAFNDASHGTAIWPGGSVPIERFNIVANGLTLAPLANQPENGWWWNADQSGRGFFIEWQGGSAFVAGYMYDASGNPIWYVSVATTPNPQSLQSTWLQFANGQTLTGPYKPNALVNGNVGSLGIQFQNSTNAILTLPNGQPLALTRFRF